MHYLIYQITNLVNQKTYIGAHKTANKNDNYMGSGKLIKRAVAKYGIDNFKKEILYVCETEKEMYQYERKLVTENYVIDDATYNLKIGGEGGFYRHSEETKSKMSIQNLAELNNMYGKKHTSETKQKISHNRIINGVAKGENNPMYGTNRIGETNPFYGYKHTTETKHKMKMSNISKYGVDHLTKAKSKIVKFGGNEYRLMDLAKFLNISIKDAAYKAVRGIDGINYL